MSDEGRSLILVFMIVGCVTLEFTYQRNSHYAMRGETMLSTQYWPLARATGSIFFSVTVDMMGMLGNTSEVPRLLPISARYSSATPRIAAEWYTTPVLSFRAKMPPRSAFSLTALMPASGPESVTLNGLLIHTILTPKISHYYAESGSASRTYGLDHSTPKMGSSRVKTRAME